MKITTERVGESVLLALENSQYAISTLLPVAMAAELAANLLLQSSLIAEDGLELPETFRPNESGLKCARPPGRGLPPHPRAAQEAISQELVRLTVGGPGPPRPELLAPVRDDRTQHARRARARKKP